MYWQAITERKKYTLRKDGVDKIKKSFYDKTQQKKVMRKRSTHKPPEREKQSSAESCFGDKICGR